MNLEDDFKVSPKEQIAPADLGGKREESSQPKLGEPTDHWHLHAICIHLPTDYEPYGYRVRDGADCSCGCKWWLQIVKEPSDWGVCVNPRSPRCGLLTFEHQGCQFFEDDPELDAKVEAQIKELNEMVRNRREGKESK